MLPPVTFAYSPAHGGVGAASGVGGKRISAGGGVEGADVERPFRMFVFVRSFAGAADVKQKNPNVQFATICGPVFVIRGADLVPNRA